MQIIRFSTKIKKNNSVFLYENTITHWSAKTFLNPNVSNTEIQLKREGKQAKDFYE